jgi:hypothetical protein
MSVPDIINTLYCNNIMFSKKSFPVLSCMLICEITLSILNLTFRGSCIVIYTYNKTNKNFSNLYLE